MPTTIVATATGVPRGLLLRHSTTEAFGVCGFLLRCALMLQALLQHAEAPKLG
jgi:hypothetical protein